jgi:hypothetical protein
VPEQQMISEEQYSKESQEMEQDVSEARLNDLKEKTTELQNQVEELFKTSMHDADKKQNLVDFRKEAKQFKKEIDALHKVSEKEYQENLAKYEEHLQEWINKGLGELQYNESVANVSTEFSKQQPAATTENIQMPKDLLYYDSISAYVDALQSEVYSSFGCESKAIHASNGDLKYYELKLSTKTEPKKELIFVTDKNSDSFSYKIQHFHGVSYLDMQRRTAGECIKLFVEKAALRKPVISDAYLLEYSLEPIDSRGDIQLVNQVGRAITVPAKLLENLQVDSSIKQPITVDSVNYLKIFYAGKEFFVRMDGFKMVERDTKLVKPYVSQIPEYVKTGIVNVLNKFKENKPDKKVRKDIYDFSADRLGENVYFLNGQFINGDIISKNANPYGIDLPEGKIAILNDVLKFCNIILIFLVGKV